MHACIHKWGLHVAGEPLIQRGDDTEEALTKRLSSYHSETVRACVRECVRACVRAGAHAHAHAHANAHANGHAHTQMLPQESGACMRVCTHARTHPRTHIDSYLHTAGGQRWRSVAANVVCAESSSSSSIYSQPIRPSALETGEYRYL